MRGKIDRDHVEYQLSFRGIEAVAAAGEISQRRAGVDPLVPSGERIAQRALDYRGTNDGDLERVAIGQHQLLAETLGVTVSVGPSPGLRALAADLLEPFLDPLLAPMLDRRLARSVSVGVVVVELRMAQLIARLGLHPRDCGERVADFPLEPKRLAPAGTPVLRNVVFVAMTVGAAGDVAGRYMHHRGAEFGAERDHVGDAGGVDLDRLFQRSLEVHQQRAVHDRGETAGLPG